MKNNTEASVQTTRRDARPWHASVILPSVQDLVTAMRRCLADHRYAGPALVTVVATQRKMWYPSCSPLSQYVEK